MNYSKLIVHPMGDDAGVEIGEIVHEFDGTLIEKKLLGMMHYEAHFPHNGKAREAMTALQSADCVSNVRRIED